MPNPDHPIAVAGAYHRGAVTRFELQGFSVLVQDDLTDWCAAFRDSERDAYFTPCFNPNHVDLGDGTFLGGLLARGTKIVAGSAIRLVVTEDLVRDELATMRIWQNKPCLGERLEYLSVTKGLPKIRGQTCHEGCTWVSPAYRRRGIAARLVSTMRALALVRWKPQWIFGFLRPETHRSGIAHKAYGYRKIAALELGYVPVMNRNVSAVLSYMSPPEAASIMRSLERCQPAGQMPAP